MPKRVSTANACIAENQIASAPVIITCDCQVEPNRNVISGSSVLAVARARMCRTSACRAGWLLHRACRREKAPVSFADVARFLGKTEMPLLCCGELWTPIPWQDCSAASTSDLVRGIALLQNILPRAQTRRATRPQSPQQEKETSGPEELRYDVVKCQAAVMNIRDAESHDHGSSDGGVSPPCSAYQSIQRKNRSRPE